MMTQGDYGIVTILLAEYDKENLHIEFKEVVKQCNENYFARWTTEQINKLAMYCDIDEKSLLSDLENISSVYYVYLDYMKDKLDKLHDLKLNQDQLIEKIPEIVNSTVFRFFSEVDFLAYTNDLYRYIAKF